MLCAQKPLYFFVSIFNACVEQGWKHMTFCFWTHAQIIFQLWPISHWFCPQSQDLHKLFYTHTCSFSSVCAVCMCGISAYASKRLYNGWVFACLLQLSNLSFTHSPLCTARLHIHPSFSSYILLFKPLLILPRPVQFNSSLSLLLTLSPLSIQSRAGDGIYLSHHTHLTPPAHKKKKLLVKFNYSFWEHRHCCTYAFIYLYIYAFVTFRLRRLSEATRLSKQKTGSV